MVKETKGLIVNMNHNNVTNVIHYHFHYHKHFIVS
jgi:hypothetical protein